MKKYVILLISLIFILSITACKPKQDPITLAARAGTYTCTDTRGVISPITMIIGSDGSITIDGDSRYSKLNPSSTETSFTVQLYSTSGTLIYSYEINFSKNLLIGAQGSSDNNTYSFIKN